MRPDTKPAVATRLLVLVPGLRLSETGRPAAQVDFGGAAA